MFSKIKILGFSILIVFALTSCKTASVYTDILIPAQISVSQDIKNIGILNRSLPGKGGRFYNILEGFVTGESIMADRQGSESVCKGLTFKVNNSPRFKATFLSNEDFRGTGTKQFPSALTWNEVHNLCYKYKVDAIVVLETFDSDSKIKFTNKTVERTIKGVKKNVLQYNSDLRMRVNVGWRIYDNKTERIIDQIVFTDEKAWKGVGYTQDESLRKLPSKRSAIDDAGYFAGEMMGVRISPNWVRASRYYYTKGDDNFARAKSFVKVNNWKDAAKVWSSISNSQNPKAAARACHNMALANELEGNIDIALMWANKAYTEHNLKREKNYIKTLNIRRNDINRLNEQLPNK